MLVIRLNQLYWKLSLNLQINIYICEFFFLFAMYSYVCTIVLRNPSVGIVQSAKNLLLQINRVKISHQGVTKYVEII